LASFNEVDLDLCKLELLRVVGFARSVAGKETVTSLVALDNEGIVLSIRAAVAILHVAVDAERVNAKARPALLVVLHCLALGFVPVLEDLLAVDREEEGGRIVLVPAL